MSVVWTPRVEGAESVPEVEDFAVTVERARNRMTRLAQAAGHWRFMTWIFLSLFTGHVVVDLGAMVWWWSSQ